MKNLYAVVAVVVITFGFWPSKLAAGTISISVESKYQPGLSNLVVKVQNKGDEAAQNASISVEFMESSAKAPVIPTLEPNLPHMANFPIAISGIVGTYPVIITVQFEALNGYPFTSIALNQLRASNSPQSPIRVSMASTEIRGSGFVKAKIYNSGDRPITVNYRFLMPRELISNDAKGSFELAPRSRETFRFHLENFSALAGATYPVHLLLEHDEGNIHYLSPGVAITTIYGKSFIDIRSRLFWIALVCVIVAISGSLLWRRKVTSPDNDTGQKPKPDVDTGELK